MAQVKGHLIYLTKKYIIEKHGNQGFQNLLSKLPDRTAVILSGGVVSGGDYDVDIDFELISAFDRTFGRAELMDLAKYKVDREITGVFGLITKFVSPDKIIARSQEMWGKMYSEGKISFTKKSEGNYLCTIKEFEYDDHYMYMILYYLQVFVEKVFGKKAQSSAKRTSKDSVEYTFSITAE